MIEALAKALQHLETTTLSLSSGLTELRATQREHDVILRGDGTVNNLGLGAEVGANKKQLADVRETQGKLIDAIANAQSKLLWWMLGGFGSICIAVIAAILLTGLGIKK